MISPLICTHFSALLNQSKNISALTEPFKESGETYKVEEDVDTRIVVTNR